MTTRRELLKMAMAALALLPLPASSLQRRKSDVLWAGTAISKPSGHAFKYVWISEGEADAWRQNGWTIVTHQIKYGEVGDHWLALRRLP